MESIGRRPDKILPQEDSNSRGVRLGLGEVARKVGCIWVSDASHRTGGAWRSSWFEDLRLEGGVRQSGKGKSDEKTIRIPQRLIPSSSLSVRSEAPKLEGKSNPERRWPSPTRDKSWVRHSSQ
jgi:hypothetical protein